MFIEALKRFVTTLVTILIFISAVEIIAPNNKMKKYIKFILGLILMSVILNPILELVSNGEKNISQGIENYETVFSQNQNKINSDNSTTTGSKEEKDSIRKKAFIKNFNENCENLLKKQYKDMNFKSDLDCDVDFTNIDLNVKKLRIGIGNNNVKKIKNIQINEDAKDNTNETNEKYKDIINFVSEQLNIPKDKIEVYEL